MRISILVILWGISLLILGCAIGLIDYVHGDDFPLPKPRPAPELCVVPDAKPSPGQVITQDKTCPSGMRWKRVRD
jgi:hypothetical protein